MLAYYMREAYLLLEEGASVPQIDKALTDFGLPVGPFGMQDIAGIDVLGHVARNLADRLPDDVRGAFALPPLIGQLIDRGWIGEKAAAWLTRRQKLASAFCAPSRPPSTSP